MYLITECTLSFNYLVLIIVVFVCLSWFLIPLTFFQTSQTIEFIFIELFFFRLF